MLRGALIKGAPKTKQPRPTDAELEILRVLWNRGPSTVRDVYEELKRDKDVGYTTVLKFMQIMVEKGLLNRDESQMKHVYSAAQEENKTKSMLLDRFIESIYNGSASSLMMQLLGNKKTSKKELDAIRELLNKMEKKK